MCKGKENVGPAGTTLVDELEQFIDELQDGQVQVAADDTSTTNKELEDFINNLP